MDITGSLLPLRWKANNLKCNCLNPIKLFNKHSLRLVMCSKILYSPKCCRNVGLKITGRTTFVWGLSASPQLQRWSAGAWKVHETCDRRKCMNNKVMLVFWRKLLLLSSNMCISVQCRKQTIAKSTCLLLSLWRLLLHWCGEWYSKWRSYQIFLDIDNEKNIITINNLSKTNLCVHLVVICAY